jgi:hypothetical protein
MRQHKQRRHFTSSWTGSGRSTKPSSAIALSIFFSLTVLFALGHSSLVSVANTISQYPVYSLSAILVALSLSYYLTRNAALKLATHNGSLLSILTSLASFALYLYSVFEQLPQLEWLSILLVFASITGFVSSDISLFALLPGTLVLGTLPFTFLLGHAVSLAAAIVLFALADYFILISYRRRQTQPQDCGLCKENRLQGHSYCYFCGKIIGPSTMAVSVRRLMLPLVLSVIILAASQVTVNLLSSSDTGIQFRSYSLTGIGTRQLLEVPDGWSVLNSSSINSSLGTIYTYNLESFSGGTISIWVSSNSSGASPVASISSYLNLSATSNGFYRWTAGNTSFIGTSVSFPVKTFNGSNLNAALVYYLLGQPYSDYTSNNGNDMRSLKDLTASYGAQMTEWDAIVGPAWFFMSSNGEYLLIALLVPSLVAIAALGRELDARNKVKFDNTLGLGDRELSLLSFISKHGRKETGAELYHRYSTQGPYKDWQSFSSVLDRLAQLKLVDLRIHVIKGTPTAYWRSNLS